MLKRARGFTLIELLVAGALVGVVLGLALKGFMEMKKLSDLTSSRLTARNEAAKAAREISTLLRRCQIIYFNGHPLGTDPDDPRLALPASLATLGFGTIPKVRFATDNSKLDDWPVSGGGFRSVDVSQFRFWAPDNAGPFDVIQGASQRLQTHDPNAADDFDKYFSMPLAYFAEAHFGTVTPNDASTSGGAGKYSSLTATYVPVNWTFYVLYLAPMPIQKDGDALLPVRGAGTQADRDKAVATDGSKWTRSTIPFQLRLLTIPGVSAHMNKKAAEPDNPHATLFGAGAYGRPYGRRVQGERTSVTTNTGMLLPAPFDFYNGKVNYDPIPLTTATALTRTDSGLSGGASDKKASGTRVNGTTEHANFNNIGNDPPSEDALGIRLDPDASKGWYAPTDKLVALYIDPDNVHGTCVRLFHEANGRFYNAYANDWPTIKAARDAGTPGNYSPFVFSDNTHPRRAVVSVTTRYRTSRQLPFQFHTETVEVELEALDRYQSSDRTRY